MSADQYDPNVDPNQRDPNTGQPSGGQQQSGGPQYGGPPYQGPQYGNQQYQGGPYGGGPHHWNQGPHHHPEKQDEKEQEKQQEKGAGMDEKYHRNPAGFVAWALIIIWLGVSLLLQNIHKLDLSSDQGWAIFAWGAGVIIIVESIVRLGFPRLRRSITGHLIWGAVAIGIGFGLWYGNWEIIGPIVVIAIGVGILLARILPRR